MAQKDITDDPELPRVSHCSIEVDICVQDILNRKAINERPIHHDFIERVAPVQSDLKLVHSMAGLWRDETKRRKRQLPKHLQEGSPFPPEVMVSMSADPRNTRPQGWIHEQEHREQIEQLISEEESNQPDISFDTFTKHDPLEVSVRTALQSVEDLHPSSLLPVLGLPSNLADETIDYAASIEVDDKNVARAVEADDDFFPEDSDEDSPRKPPTISAVETKRREDCLDDVSGDALRSPAPGNQLWGTLAGIYRSSLQTDYLPTVSITETLLQAADDEGLIGRARSGDTSAKASAFNLKRLASASNLVSGARKRTKVKIDAEQSGHDQSPAIISTVNHTLPRNTLPKRLRSSSRDIASENPDQSTLPRAPSQTLDFPIVKDPNDPGTRIRLSQQSQGVVSPQIQDLQKKQSVEASHPAEVRLSGRSPSVSGARSFDHDTSLKIGPQRDQKMPRIPGNSRTMIYADLAPSVEEVTQTMNDHALPQVLYLDAHYSNEQDVPDRPRQYAGREYHPESTSLPFLPAFDPSGSSPANFGIKIPRLEEDSTRTEDARRRAECSFHGWEIGSPPPSYQEVKQWYSARNTSAENVRGRNSVQATQHVEISQIVGATPRNRHGFKYSQKVKRTSVEHEVQYMSTMSLELHVNTRGKFVPNPEEDEIQCIFWALKSDEVALNSQDPNKAIHSGVVVLDPERRLSAQFRKQVMGDIVEEDTELDLMTRMIEIVRSYDPDILTGYEVHGSSWGYLIERARLKYDYNLCDEFSRMRSQSHGRFGKENDRWGFNTTSTIRVTGRHMLNIWRAMRGELNLLQYTMENVTWHLLHRRIPHYSWKSLTAWYKGGKPRELHKVLQYYSVRTKIDIEILEANELIARTSEQARLLGVDFFSVFSRGSQYKVESIMFRIAKPENFILVSPSRKQVGGQNALECLPLVMEPQSAFYSSPLLVLDFQSLYPSVMIAYNLCYSTFLGRITNWRGMNKMGFTEYKRQQGLLALLKNYINIAPNGMMYSKVEIRKSLLAKMLTEILETRVMVKSGMKKDKDDRTLQQLLNNRQLALKLLANVTYGYTSASFSGRMPCSEIADSIVQTARETLERAIAFIHSVDRWGAEVVYGDTDSLFIYLKGRTRDQAFDIGQEIAREITRMNPQPIKLKFEKVYHPCVLLAKKRYVGYKFESKNQMKPDFDAKGIETVRRDGTPAEQKIEEKALRLLFETADLSQIKRYFQKQCRKIMDNRVSIQDFCFAREVKLGTYSNKGPPPAGALISTKRMLEDARAEPQYGERVPYVVITGAPGARLIDRCVAPEDLLTNPHWQLDAEYYILKNLIPPLERIFNLTGANVRSWYDEMPKVQKVMHAAAGGRKMTLESYMRSASCLVCREHFRTPTNGREEEDGTQICPDCSYDASLSLVRLQKRLTEEEKRYEDVLRVCRSCSGLGPLEEVSCDSKDCPVFWTRKKTESKVIEERSRCGPVIRGLADGEDVRNLEW